jgi:hypothetical protein
MRDCDDSAVDIESGAEDSGMVLLDWGCQEGMRLGGTIIVDRRFVNIFRVNVVGFVV